MGIILSTPEELKQMIREVLQEHEEKKAKAERSSKLLTINQVAKRLGLAHSTVKNRVIQGVIRSTRDGRIPEEAVEEYLMNQ